MPADRGDAAARGQRDRPRRAGRRPVLRARPDQPAARARGRAAQAARATAPEGHGYWIVSADGRVRAFGDAHFYGDLRGRHARLADRRVGRARANGKGYWLAGAERRGLRVRRREVLRLDGRPRRSTRRSSAWPPRRTGKGYILLGADGGIFTFGDAHFYGSTGGMHLNAPVLDLAMTPDRARLLVRRGRRRRVLVRRRAVPRLDRQHAPRRAGDVDDARPTNGQGYWMVAADGGIFAFNVPFEGSMPVGARPVRLPVRARRCACVRCRRATATTCSAPTARCTRSARRSTSGRRRASTPST